VRSCLKVLRFIDIFSIYMEIKKIESLERKMLFVYIILTSTV